MNICRKCIVPDTYPGVDFIDGICAFCRIHDERPRLSKEYLGEDKLLEILKSGHKASYNCLVPVSGGKDSSYSLYHIAKKMGLKPLAAHFDSGFISEAAKKNVEKICNDLSIDLVIGHASKYRKEMLKESFKAARYNIHEGMSGIGGICFNCENNLRSFAIKTAKENKIPFIVWSSTDFEDSPYNFMNPENKSFKTSYGELSGSIGLKRMKRIYEGIVGDYRVLKYFWKLPFMWNSLKHAYYRVMDNRHWNAPGKLSKIDPFIEVSFNGSGVNAVYFYDYIAYDPFRFIEILNREVGWEATKGKDVRQDCLLHHLSNYRSYKKNGITNDGFFLSVLVRDGKLSREEAMEKEQLLESVLKKNAEMVLKHIDVEIDIDSL